MYTWAKPEHGNKIAIRNLIQGDLDRRERESAASRCIFSSIVSLGSGLNNLLSSSRVIVESMVEPFNCAHVQDCQLWLGGIGETRCTGFGRRKHSSVTALG